MLSHFESYRAQFAADPSGSTAGYDALSPTPGVDHNHRARRTFA
jgi:hypothetical protein